ncbi:asparaginase [Domibacillus epiphyticus]|uniref:asparaginase n=1 Tax=Domibacillus epiphyticus TaxID=1714355 RepID=A0A1V2A4E9_9BACI|nr:asparaginase [Domibacillus epiphyticus]OMP65881.1 L-asparaginase [Domibacillus epiphyticus]
MTPKNLLLIHTGGTISMKANEETGAVDQDGKNPIASLNEFPGIDAVFSVKEPFQIPSPHMTVNEMMTIKELIDQTEAEGVVITHGTDTMEETAYFLDLTLTKRIPVVFTGAMRSSNETGSDGPSNLISAVKTAMSEEAHDKGVLVVMNDAIHSARYVTKANCGTLAAFQSPDTGPIGVVLNNTVHFFHTPMPSDTFDIKNVNLTIPVLTAYAGMDTFLFNQLSSCDGLVIEALGQGNLPPAAAQAVIELIQSGLPVLITSRCVSGIVQPTYSYEGGGRTLQEAGALFSGGLNGQKARLKLLAALSAGRKEDLPAIFP